MVTLKDVAERAGVSTQLVSLVVNGKAKQQRIAPATARRVEMLAREMGYDNEKSYSARRMVARRSGRIIPSDVIAVCMTVHNVEKDDPHAYEKDSEAPPAQGDLPFASDILQGIERAAFEVGLDVLICRHCTTDLPRMLARKEVDGVIALSAGEGVFEKIAELKMPTVKLVDRLVGTKLPFSNVVMDNKAGITLAVEHLVELGHKNIAYLGHPLGTQKTVKLNTSRERPAIFQDAMQKCGIKAPYLMSALTSQNLETSAAAARQLWEQSKGVITAIVCHNDIFAMGAIRGLQSCGLQVPQDVSVTGFDDISGQFAFVPAVTSIFYDRFKMGERAVQMLWQARPDWLEGKTPPLFDEVLPVELARYDSTAPVKK